MADVWFGAGGVELVAGCWVGEGVDDDVLDGAFVAEEGLEAGAGGDFPDDDAFVGGAGEEEAGGDGGDVGEAFDKVGVAEEGEEGFASLGVPHYDGAVPGACKEDTAGLVEGEAGAGGSVRAIDMFSFFSRLLMKL